jgi:hypothetical protein
LFHIQDLWERTGLVNVVECLAALAQKAEEKGFKPTLKPIKVASFLQFCDFLKQ